MGKKLDQLVHGISPISISYNILGQICTKIKGSFDFKNSDKFCEVKLTIIKKRKYNYLQEELGASLFNLNQLFPTLDFAANFLQFNPVSRKATK